MEKGIDHELIHLMDKRLDLREQFETNTIPNIQILDEYFETVTKYYQKKASQGGYDHEEMYQMALHFDDLHKGSMQKKWEYCMLERKDFVIHARNHEREGRIALAQENETKANNLLQLA